MTSPVRRRGALAATLVSVVLVAVAACSRTPADKDAPDASEELARLQRSTLLLQRQLDLAAGKDFYLVLDPAAPDLTLMLRGAELQRYAVLGLQVGRARIAWIGRTEVRPWRGVIWTDGELDPPRQIDRLVIEAAPPGKDAGASEDPPIPPTPEEMYPVPPRYHVRFADGLSLEIRPREADETLGRWARARAWWSTRWHDAIAAMGGGDHDAVRLRIVLKPKDANSLYRSLPPEVRLLVVGGGSGVPGSPAAVPAGATSTGK